MKKIVMLLAVVVLPAFAKGEWNEFDSVANIATLFHAGKLEQAELAMHEHLKNDVHPKPDTCLLAARIYIARGKLDRAHAILEELLLYTKDYRPWFLFGVTDVRLGRLEEGVEALHKSIELNPSHGPSYLWLAKASHGSPKQSLWLKQVLILESQDSPSAKEALQMLKDLNKKGNAQPSSPPDSE